MGGLTKYLGQATIPKNVLFLDHKQTMQKWITFGGKSMDHIE